MSRPPDLPVMPVLPDLPARSRPAVLFPLMSYAVVQAAVAAMFLVAGRGRYAQLVSAWDGGFYLSIAQSGRYGVKGGEGEWSYYPAYSFLVRGVSAATGLPVLASAVTVSLVAGAGAMVVLYLFLSDVLDARAARVVTLLTCTWMAAPVLQMTYTDGLQNSGHSGWVRARIPLRGCTFRRVGRCSSVWPMRLFSYEFNCGQEGSGEPGCVAAAAGRGTFDWSLGWPVGGPGRGRGVHLRAGHVWLRGRR